MTVRTLAYPSVYSNEETVQAIIALLVQMFFAWRIKVLTGNWFVVVIVSFCSFAQWCKLLSTSLYKIAANPQSTGGGLGTAIAVGMYGL